MRTDTHSPSHFDPAAYEYVGSFDNWPEPGAFRSNCQRDLETAFGLVLEALNWEHAEYVGGRQLLRERGAKIHFDPDGDKNNCDHCGARCRYIVVFRHTPSGQVIAVGEQCANERFGCDSRRTYDIKRLRERVANKRERERAFGAAVGFIEKTAPELRDWFLSPAADEVGGIFAQLAHKLVRYGALSEKQVEFARRLLQEHYERQRNGGKTERELEIEREHEAAEDCPRGRVTITGTVIKCAEHESDWGVSWKLTVKDDRGFLVWLTCPATLDASRGDRIQITASVEPSQNDPKFGFGKRPARAEILTKAQNGQHDSPAR
jgi:hypothetical protein